MDHRLSSRRLLCSSYSPTFGEEVFYEVRIRLRRVASCLWWKGLVPAEGKRDRKGGAWRRETRL
jgi:hypothetical protein